MTTSDNGGFMVIQRLSAAAQRMHSTLVHAQGIQNMAMSKYVKGCH